MAKSKEDRLIVIRQIVTTQDISNQSELLEQLQAHGYELTQATLSRDMKEMQIIKVSDGHGRYFYRVAPNNVSRQVAPVAIEDVGTNHLIARSVVSLEFSGQIAVLKTRPGYAAAIADIIDKGYIDSVMGTIAGDDTLLIIMREGYDKRAVSAALVAKCQIPQAIIL